MDNIWYNVHQFYRQVSKFLTDRRLVDMEHLLKLGQNLLKEDIGEEKVQILFSLAGVCEAISDKRALEYWDKIIDCYSNNDDLLRALLYKAMFYMKNNEKSKGKETGDLLMKQSKLCSNNTYMMHAWEFYGKADFDDCNYNSALEAYSEMYFYSEKVYDMSAQYRALVKMGIIWNRMGKKGMALSNLMKANVLALKSHNPINIEIAEFLRGQIFVSYRKHEEASKIFEDCEKILERLF